MSLGANVAVKAAKSSSRSHIAVTTHDQMPCGCADRKNSCTSVTFTFRELATEIAKQQPMLYIRAIATLKFESLANTTLACVAPTPTSGGGQHRGNIYLTILRD